MKIRTVGSRALAALVLLGGAGTLPAQTVPDHSSFTRVLGEAVDFPRVDYERLQRSRASLDRYLLELARTDSAELDRAPREVQLAFWINAYNACMLGLVIDHYPIERRGVRITQRVQNFLARRPHDSVWWIPDVFDGEFCEVAGRARSLDEIEHEIIRPRYGEPRIHFAVNCAAMSCPPLWPEAYVADRLDEQLERATTTFMDDPEHFVLERSSPAILRVNRILDWFSEDFGGEEGVKRFFARRVEGRDRELLLAPDTGVEYFDYDWTLNDTGR